MRWLLTVREINTKIQIGAKFGKIKEINKLSKGNEIKLQIRRKLFYFNFFVLSLANKPSMKYPVNGLRCKTKWLSYKRIVQTDKTKLFFDISYSNPFSHFLGHFCLVFFFIWKFFFLFSNLWSKIYKYLTILPFCNHSSTNNKFQRNISITASNDLRENKIQELNSNWKQKKYLKKTFFFFFNEINELKSIGWIVCTVWLSHNI